MQRALIIVTSSDPGYLRIWEHLVRRELAAGRPPLVVDATPTLAVGNTTFHLGALRLLGLPAPGFDLSSRLEELGAEVLSITSCLDGFVDAPLDEEAERLLQIAVQSAMITYFRTDDPDRKVRRIGRTAARLTLEGRIVYFALTKLINANPDIDLVYVPNGRTPNQKMTSLVARRTSLEAIHFEKGETADGAYLQRYAPQDRVASQESAHSLLAGRSGPEIGRFADEWISRRSPAPGSRNEFAALWSDQSEVNLRDAASTGVVGFFTSSQDEFQFLGPEWQLHEWADQFEAFDAILTEFDRRGYSSYLRVHPNLATKSHTLFVREREGIRELARKHPRLRIVWHDDPTNTYSLLEQSDAVVVWDSTVGLEASARGLPVWSAATTRYGLVADIRELLCSADLRTVGVEPWKVDSSKARSFIAYLMLRDEQMDPNYTSWLPWSSEKPPIRSAFARLLASGGAPYAWDAVASTIDVYRHRSLRANLRRFRRG